MRKRIGSSGPVIRHSGYRQGRSLVRNYDWKNSLFGEQMFIVLIWLPGKRECKKIGVSNLENFLCGTCVWLRLMSFRTG
jgi:hypothetical protein